MTDDESQGGGSLLALTLLAVIAGALTGLVGAIFRLSLEQADRLRDAMMKPWAFCWLSPHARPRLRSPPGWFAAFRRTRREAASLTSKPFCAASFRQRRFS